MPTAEMTAERMPVACFAPPLTDALIDRYAALADALPDSRGDVRDAMRECLAAARLWWELPESNGTPKDMSVEVKHRGKDTLVKIVCLTPDLVQKLWDAVPWGYEIAAMSKLFGRAFHGIDPDTGEQIHEPWIMDKAVCDAAFHLLWFARELALDREPLTQEKLPA